MAEQEHRTLGQVCFEGMWRAQSAATGAYGLQWADVPADVRSWWEAGGAAVKGVVLAEQGEPTGPQDMAHATLMRDRAIRELKEAVQDISRACVYRDALAQSLEGIRGGRRARRRASSGMDEQTVTCGACGEAVVVVGYDGDGRPFVREHCPVCGEAVDMPDATEPYYSLAESPR
jgi:endogenous inhibitor of DNA gyrase (YacG/DUF329 family)